MLRRFGRSEDFRLEAGPEHGGVGQDSSCLLKKRMMDLVDSLVIPKVILTAPKML